MGDIAEHTRLFHKDGYLEIGSVLNVKILEDLYDLSKRLYEEIRAKIVADNLSFSIGTKNGFMEIVERHANRFEMPYMVKENDLVKQVRGNEFILSLVKSILGEDCILINQSFVISFPGAQDQTWHSDGAHVSLSEHLPSHVLNVFIPLIDFTLDVGPTEFRPGSQVYTRDLTRLFLLAKLKKTLRAPTIPQPKRGDIMLWDYRVLHRGTANKSDHMRPALALTFAKPWFRDIVNFPHRSIFSESKEGDCEETQV